MELVVLPADAGDCLILRSNDGTAILVDGGKAPSFREAVAPHLGELVPKKFFDLVCVTHIDDDHINGIVAYFQMLAADGAGGRPKELWHNNLSDQLGPELGAEVASVLESAKALLDSDDSLRGITSGTEGIMGVPKADELSGLAVEMEDVALNAGFTNRVVTVEGAPARIAFGSIEIQLIAPFKKRLEELKNVWRMWLSEHPGYRPLLEQATGMDPSPEALRPPGLILGDISEVTKQNLASIMFLARGDDRTFLMTGDGHSTHILDGMRHVGAMDDRVHVDVLKVPHHGSEDNMKDPFCRQVTADHYVFCADGANQNPDPRIVDMVVNARKGEDDEAPYSLWFSNSSATVKPSQITHMQDLEAKVDALCQQSKERFAYHFRQPEEPYLVVPRAVE
jgi:hypothetical protein